MLGWLQLLSEQLDASSGSFSQAIELDRSFAEGHGGMAALAALRGDNQKAQQLIEVAERLDPECLGSRFARSVLLGAQGDAQAAQQLILSALTGLSGAGDGPLQRLIAQAGRGRS